jgi:hypothetical protein
MRNLLFMVTILCSAFAHAQSRYADSLVSLYHGKITPHSLLSLSDLLYCGIDNNLTISYPDKEASSYKVFLKTQNGKVLVTDDGFITIPRSTGKSFFVLYLITPRHDTLQIGRKEFTVVNVPLPCLKIGKVVIKDQIYVDRQIFMGSDSLKLFFTDDIPESNDWFQIKYFTIDYSNGGVYNTIDNNGPVFTDKAKQIISHVQPFKELYIKVITIAPTMITKYMPSISFRVR